MPVRLLCACVHLHTADEAIITQPGSSYGCDLEFIYLLLVLMDFFLFSLVIHSQFCGHPKVQRAQNIYFHSGFIFIWIYFLLRKNYTIKTKVGVTKE